MGIIRYRRFFLFFSGAFVALSALALIFWRLTLGIDFLGGTLWEVELKTGDERLTAGELKDFFEKNLGLKDVSVSPSENQRFLIRLPHLTELEHQSHLGQLKFKFKDIEEVRFDAIGPAIGKELRQKAIWAILLVLFGISLYVTFAFRKVSQPIRSWKYGAITLVTLFHDVMIPLGLFSVLGYFRGVSADINFVVAVLVVMGFSVHDTIVVFDRIRENLLSFRQNLNFEGLRDVIGRSVSQTMTRSVNTSLTLILVLLALLFFGPSSLWYFILTILVGVTFGTYSSICIASPLLLLMSGAKKPSPAL
ncbi:MAG: protein translocase subunit SecF [Candidatus Magasanikbacteria bacterium]|nr:protein translocase subunit SecF [Candidatus Magasanikbacteria bacterium]